MQNDWSYYNEFDPHAAEWLRRLIEAKVIAPGLVDERDIRDVCPRDLEGFTQCHFFAGVGIWSYCLRQAGWRDDQPVWTASAPCQPFSAAGAGDGFDDERHLWPAFHWLLQQCRPEKVVGEQVASKDGLNWLDLVSADLEGTLYAIGAVDTCAAGFGAPHIRQRLFWAAEDLRPATGWMGHNGGPGLEIGERVERIQPGKMGTFERQAFVGRSAACELANAEGIDRGLSEGQERCEGHEPVGHRQDGGLANSDGGHTSPERKQRGGQHGQQSQYCRARGMANTSGKGRQQVAGRPLGDETENGRARRDTLQTQHDHISQRHGEDSRPGPTNGFWRDADWLFCQDGYWRPVEPGTSPLATGATARMGRLSAYGNGLNTAQATAFIEAYMERHIVDLTETIAGNLFEWSGI